MFKDCDKFTNIFYHKDKRDFNFCDCYGICYLFNKEVLNKEIPKYLGEDIYSKDSINALYNTKKNEWTKISKGKEFSGDVVSINMRGMPVHVGVVVEKGTMLHIMENRHAVIESYNSTRWKNKLDSFWRYESTK